jgi:hypothetical protein
MTSQSVVWPHVSQNYCHGLKIESVHKDSCSVAARTAVLNNSALVTVTSDILCSLDGIVLSHSVAGEMFIQNFSYFVLPVEELQVIGGVRSPMFGREREVGVSGGISIITVVER